MNEYDNVKVENWREICADGGADSGEREATSADLESYLANRPDAGRKLLLFNE